MARFKLWNRVQRLVMLISLAIAALLAGNLLWACPFCLSPPMTLAEEIETTEIVAIVELLRFEVVNTGNRELPRSTVRIREYLQGSELVARCDRLQAGQSIVMDQEITGSPGDLFLLYGSVQTGSSTTETTFAADTSNAQSGSSDEGKVVTADLQITNPAKPLIRRTSFVIPEFISWDSNTPVSLEAIRYIKAAPARSLSAAQRLPYFITFLEHADPLLSIDAWSEFANASYEDVKAVRNAMPRTKLRRWICDPAMSPERLGLYGLMLGICGDAEDAEFLKSQIGIEPPSNTANSSTFRYGTDGLMGGYLLLTGEEGVAFLEQSRLRPDAPVDGAYAAVAAMQFVWSYEGQLITQSRLKSAMRQTLASDGLRNITITNLARWKDWECWPELERLFNHEFAEDHAARKTIVLFAEECRKATNTDGSATIEASAAAKFLADAEQRHPELFRSTYKSDFNSPF